jgi:hypothetical protein
MIDYSQLEFRLATTKVILVIAESLRIVRENSASVEKLDVFDGNLCDITHHLLQFQNLNGSVCIQADLLLVLIFYENLHVMGNYSPSNDKVVIVLHTNMEELLSNDILVFNLHNLLRLPISTD